MPQMEIFCHLNLPPFYSLMEQLQLFNTFREQCVYLSTGKRIDGTT